MKDNDQLSLLTDRQNEIISKLEALLEKQAEDHSYYAKTSSERMETLNRMMTNYIEIQKTHLEQYVKHIDNAVESRKCAQRELSIALDALREEQSKSKQLMEIIIRMKSEGHSASVSIGTIQ